MEVLEKKISLEGRKLMLAIPAYDGKVCIETAYMLPQLAMAAMQYRFQLTLAHISGSSILTKARNILVGQFLDTDFTDLLFVDTDITFTVHDVIRMMAVATEKDVVAGACPRRDGQRLFYFEAEKDLEFDNQGLLKVDKAGTGFMLIRRHVIENLVNAHPEWKYWDDIQGKEYYSIFDFFSGPDGYMGEDYLFCKRVHEAGMTVYLDPETNLGHYGRTLHTANFSEEVVKPYFASQKHLKVVND